MDVLHLRASRGFYGAERAVLDVAAATRRAGLRVGIAALVDGREPHTELLEAASEAGLPGWRIASRGRADIRPLRALVELLHHEAPRVLHVHGYKALVLGWLASRLVTVPLVVTRHGETGESPSVRLYEALARSLLSQADRVVAVSAREAEVAQACGAGARTHHIPNGVDAAGVARRVAAAGPVPRDAAALQDGRPFVLGVGRLSPEKGYGDLLQAVATLAAPRPEVVIAGGGPLRRRLRSQADSLGVRLHLLGYVRDLAPWWRSARLLCQPSLREGLPLAVLEAMAAGLPVLATRVGALPALLGGAAPAGWLVDPGDQGALAAALESLLSDDETERRRRIRRARAVLAERHSVDAVAQRHVREIYEPLARESREGGRR